MQTDGTAGFSVGMAAAFHAAEISLSVFSAYPPGHAQAKPSWPAVLYRLFEQAEQVPPQDNAHHTTRTSAGMTTTKHCR